MEEQNFIAALNINGELIFKRRKLAPACLCLFPGNCLVVSPAALPAQVLGDVSIGSGWMQSAVSGCREQL